MESWRKTESRLETVYRQDTKQLGAPSLRGFSAEDKGFSYSVTLGWVCCEGYERAVQPCATARATSRRRR